MSGLCWVFLIEKFMGFFGGERGAAVAQQVEQVD